MLKIGSIIEIPLSHQQKAYGQYVYKDKVMGPLLQIYKPISREHFDIQLLSNVHALFPPVITGLNWAIRQGIWNLVGYTKVKDFTYPKYIKTFYDEKTGKGGVWYLWNGEESIRLGYELLPEYKKLEYLVVWSPYDIVERIETGIYPYPYGDLIKYNRFTPRQKKKIT